MLDLLGCLKLSVMLISPFVRKACGALQVSQLTLDHMTWPPLIGPIGELHG